ncbi:hypothetical protein NQ317_003897 [Molorchus minor]|uniref:SERRATE/Ars2 N-terminal domain-containing protein n=1 Tax=Molorchus minor TaxID=1323400 RepID=A0ABQ9ITP9_9CUCU|nr:hypothetical protein NQ317_003897 [Molorchus minor]
MSFKAFLATQDDNISDSEAIEKYNDYKLEFQRQQLNEFFVAHKDDEWFKPASEKNLAREQIKAINKSFKDKHTPFFVLYVSVVQSCFTFRLKYHPEDSVRRKEEQMAALKRKTQGPSYHPNLNINNFDYSLQEQDDNYISHVIKLGVTVEDLALLEQEYEEMEQKYREQKAKEVEAEKVKEAKEVEKTDKKEEGEVDIEKIKTEEETKPNGESAENKDEDGEIHDKEVPDSKNEEEE